MFNSYVTIFTLALALSSYLAEEVNGFNFAKNPLLNKGVSFTQKEKESLKIAGLFPGGKPIKMETKVENLMKVLRSKSSPIEKYQYLHTIMDSEEALYFAALNTHLKELMPIVYTPTVGEACQKWSSIHRQTIRGLYISMNDAGNILNLLDNYPNKDIDAIVFTDGERILGLGDLGVNGMGIPVGKLALYTAVAGISPERVLPVHIDVGTENEALWADDMYPGLKQPRLRGQAYDDLIKEFMDAAKTKYGRHVLLQFEDFGNSNAFRLLEDHRESSLCFNDDIQGTASVALAGLISSLPMSFPDNKDATLGDHTFLFYGAGEAGVGIADLLSDEIAASMGISIEEARKRVWLMDSQGLVTDRRMQPAHIGSFAEHKRHYAHPCPKASDKNAILSLEDAVNTLKPTVLIGVSAQSQAFTKPVVEAMSKACKESPKNPAMPVIMALSNPTSKAECTAQQAYEWTNGKTVFISGSPFDPVTLPGGRTFTSGQGNNAYIFPGVGLGALAIKGSHLTDEDFRVAARTLANSVDDEMRAKGSAYPPLTELQRVSLDISVSVADNILKTGRSGLTNKPANIKEIRDLCAKKVYNPFDGYKHL